LLNLIYTITYSLEVSRVSCLHSSLM
jgi:hypothetical protein